MNHVRYIDLRLMDYKQAWDYQQEIQNRLIQEKISGSGSGELPCLIFVEHPHVYTLGKSGKENNLLINDKFLESIQAAYYKTDRGGDITYHGPGQIVGYPVFDLDQMKTGVKGYISRLEDAIISTLEGYGIASGRLPGATGVWIEPGKPGSQRKICAIGVKVSRGITMHGFALNVNTNLSYFNHINPCGFTDKGVTSMEKELGKTVNFEEVKGKLRSKIALEFGLTLT